MRTPRARRPAGAVSAALVLSWAIASGAACGVYGKPVRSQPVPASTRAADGDANEDTPGSGATPEEGATAHDAEDGEADR